MPYFERVQRQLRELHPHLPLPPDAAIALSEQLTQRLQQQIAEHGPMPFQTFMQQILYAPGLGYYSAGLAKLGAAGDFITAPELSPLFSQCLAHCFAAPLQQPNRSVLELGAGRGVMAAEMLRAWQSLDCLPSTYYILEVSADLRAVQRASIAQHVPELLSRVQWIDHWPQQFCGVVVANEVLDAMPFCLFTVHGNRVMERAVTCEQNGQFKWAELPADTILQQWFAHLPDEIRAAMHDGYQGEVLLSLPAWLQGLYQSIDSAHVVLIDYGFPQHELYLAERDQGTLMCHFRHHAHSDPLRLVGLQDVTCHVDFSAVADAAFDAGFSISGYSSQAGFLQSAGILNLAQSDDVATRFGYSQQLKRLLLPSEMGELFKVICLSKNTTVDLPGFAINDRRHSL